MMVAPHLECLLGATGSSTSVVFFLFFPYDVPVGRKVSIPSKRGCREQAEQAPASPISLQAQALRRGQCGSSDLTGYTCHKVCTPVKGVGPWSLGYDVGAPSTRCFKKLGPAGAPHHTRSAPTPHPHRTAS